MATKKIVILISGNGSNLQSFIDQQADPDFKGEVVAVVSNRPNAYGLQRAIKSNIPSITIDHSQFESREAFDQALMVEIDKFCPDLIILAGFMRILTPRFVTYYCGKLLNIHPSLLPKYTGLHTHKRAIANNDKHHGTSVHFVTAELDGGPVIAQSKTSIDLDETEETLTGKVQALEHKLFPATANLLLANKIVLIKEKIYFEGKLLEKPIVF